MNRKLFVLAFFLFCISLPNECHGANESAGGSIPQREQRVTGTGSIRPVQPTGTDSFRQIEQPAGTRSIRPEQPTGTRSIRPEQPTGTDSIRQIEQSIGTFSIRTERQASTIRHNPASHHQGGNPLTADASPNKSIRSEHGQQGIGGTSASMPATSSSAHGGGGQTTQQIVSIRPSTSSSSSRIQPSSSSIIKSSGSNTEIKMNKIAKNEIERLEKEMMALKKENDEIKKENFQLKNALAKFKEENNYFGKCPICFLPFNVNDISALECGHTYHPECINRWNNTNHKCPQCIKKIKNIIPLFIDEDATKDEFTKTRQIDGIDWIIYDWKAYKFNVANCSSKITISYEGGLVLKNSGNEKNSARSDLPIPPYNPDTRKSTISFYYEVEFLDDSFLFIGFCDKHYPLEGKTALFEKNTIGIFDKEGILIDGSFIDLGNGIEHFKEGDFVGIGIIHRENSKMESFVTCNGKLIGKVELPTKFAIIELFPVINLFRSDELILVNFNKEEWQFKEFKQALE